MTRIPGFLRRSLLAAAVLFGAAAAMSATTPAVSAEPDPSSVYIQAITYGGSGCPQGSVGSSFANDRKSFTLIFDSFVASSGPGVPATEGRKNCQLNINLHVPAGVGVAVATFDYRGYVQAPAGASAEQKATYFFNGAQISGTSTDFTGPIAKDYLSRDPVSVTIPASCTARVIPLNINAQVQLIGANGAQAQITTDSIDGKVVTSTISGACTKDDCKQGGWQNFTSAPGPFKNQGDCVSYFATGGKNPGNGN